MSGYRKIGNGWIEHHSSYGVFCEEKFEAFVLEEQMRPVTERRRIGLFDSEAEAEVALAGTPKEQKGDGIANSGGITP